MFFKRILTESIAHYSYIIGDGVEAVVVDPQADIDKYLEVARQEGLKITSILETHRNEDFIAGSKALSDATGAKVMIAADDSLDYQYGERINDGETIELGEIIIKAIATPGHTLGHMAYLLSLKDNPYIVFSGDALFFGGVGRTDFYGKDKLKEMTELLYESIFNRLLPLGDSIILCPAHGAGSACGASIDERPSSTLGYERMNSPYLQHNSKEEFVESVGQMLYKPHYFELMERENLKGHESIDCNPVIKVLHPSDLNLKQDNIIDIRNQRAFLGEHIENALFVERGGIASYLNWFVGTDEKLTFITDIQDKDYMNNLFLDMRRMGYKKELSFLANGMKDWNADALNIVKTKFILPHELKEQLNDSFILDIREEDEFKDIEPIERSHLIALQQMKDRFAELPKDQIIYVVCASGIRSSTVVSFLEKKGLDASVLLGGIKAWKNLD